MANEWIPTSPLGDIFPIPDLMPEIVARRNIEDSVKYVVDHLENASQREHERKKEKEYCDRLEKELSVGTFHIDPSTVRSMLVHENKDRIVQVPTVYDRCGCHTVMVPFEAHVYPTLITNTAASIKGRGMHWLHHILEEDLLADPLLKFFYQMDIHHYYDCINQDRMKMVVRQYTSDPILLPIFDNFITIIPQGLSKGLRSSQCFSNLYLNEIDHKMCDKVSYHLIDDPNVEGGKGVAVSGKGSISVNGKIIRYHYYRYCDDIVILGYDKKELWVIRDYLKRLLAELDLTIKPSEAVRPIEVGIDYLGYCTYNDDSSGERQVFSRVRKRTKQKFARRLHNVKSRKRRQSLIGSFFGMAAYGDCRNLLKKLITPTEFNKLKHKRKMNSFENFKVTPPTLDGKKNFKGNKATISDIDHKGVIVVDFERDVVPRREREEYNRRLQNASAQGIDEKLVEKPKTKYILQIIVDGQLRKLWTGDKELWQILDQIEEQGGLPFYVGIVIDYSGQYKKINFVPASSLNLRTPSDQELAQLLHRFNLNQ